MLCDLLETDYEGVGVNALCASLSRRGGISTKNFDESLLHLAPLAPQLWGEPEFQSPPELGDLGGKKASDANQRTCV